MSAPAPSLPARIFGYLIAGVFCGAGPLLLLLMTVTGVERALFLHASRAADGVVTGLSAAPSRSSRKSYAPVFSFNNSDGESFTVISNIAQSPPPWRFGDHVRVLYEPRHPENAHIDSLAQLWEPEIVMGVVGSGFSVIPALIVLRRRRADPSTK